MDFKKIFQRSLGLPTMSDKERKRAVVLIVEPDPDARQNIRQILSRHGYGTIYDSPDHLQALKKLEERHVSHIIFEAKKTSMPAMDFLVKVLEYDSNIICVPSSSDPNVDDVFNMLIVGARGYMVKPISESGVDDALVLASKGEPLSEAILYAKDRNEALSALCMSSLDKLALTLRQGRQFETALRDIPKRESSFKRAVDLARTFCDGGMGGFLNSMLNFCIERGQGPASQLGRLRKRLEAKKIAMQAKKQADQAQSQNPT